MGKIKFEEEKKPQALAEAPTPNEPNPPLNRAVTSGMVRIRNVSQRDIVEGELTIKPGEEAELPEDRVVGYAHKVRRI
jgi:hypothetical protein